MEEKNEVVKQLEFFVSLFDQLKAAYEIKNSENNTMSYFSMFYEFEKYD